MAIKINGIIAINDNKEWVDSFLPSGTNDLGASVPDGQHLGIPSQKWAQLHLSNNAYIGGNASIDGNIDGDGTLNIAGNATISGNLTNSSIVPIGTIVAWHASHNQTPALPEGWVECNGQNVTDSESPYLGKYVPWLNSTNRFLRGTDGATGNYGGEETNVHVAHQTGEDLAPDASHYTDGTWMVDHDNRPPFMDVRWIIRIK